MHKYNSRKPMLAPLGAALVLSAVSARADVVTAVGPNQPLILGLTWSATGSGTQSPATITGNPGNSSGPVNVSDLRNNAASNYSLTDSFAAANGAYASGSVLGQHYNFVDTYVIDVPNSIASAYVFSLSLTQQTGIQNLSARLYAYSANGVQNLTIGGTGSVTGVASPWSADSNGVVSSTQLFDTNVPSGEYVFQIVGLETGTQSGMYNGSLAIAPVPLPATAWLLASALAGSIFLARRRAVNF
jgi:hypothetical protein